MLFVAVAAAAVARQPPQETHDGLQLQSGSKEPVVYSRPGADLSDYSRIALLKAYVAFKKNWQRDYNEQEADLERRISDKDMQRMREQMAEEFQKVFTEVLSKEGGHEMVTEGADGVLIIRPAIIDLTLAAPDKMTAGMDETYAAYAGEMTLYMELYDGKTGQIIYRIIDRRAAGSDFWRARNSVTNRADADRVLRHWARLLNSHLAQLKKS
jgi:hypothetical protein